MHQLVEKTLIISRCTVCMWKRNNTYCFSTTTLVARTRLNVTLYVHCLFWLSSVTECGFYKSLCSSVSGFTNKSFPCSQDTRWTTAHLSVTCVCLHIRHYFNTITAEGKHTDITWCLNIILKFSEQRCQYKCLNVLQARITEWLKK